RLVAIASFSDPSANMRLTSLGVALDVIRHDMLLGVGYGNFQEYAAYGAEFDNFIDLFRATLYKSDIALLNLWAEMGVFGFLIAYFFAATFYNLKVLPLMILPVLILMLNGSLLLPQLFVLAAIAGTFDYRS
ncbi:MAG: O-antigen ligase family protein, partial [Alphaproteobacteria bacterium]